jgi:hypothetical protein
MRREKQYDMFDVATGGCTLDEYLFQRYSENDLSSSFWVDEKDEVDELRAPKTQPDGRPGTEPEVVPIQGPRAPKEPETTKPPPLPEGLEPDSPPGPTRTAHLQSTSREPQKADGMDSLQNVQPIQPEAGQETFQASSQPAESGSSDTFRVTTPQAPEDVAPQAPSMEDLLARFHQATKEYEKRSTEDGDSEDNDDAAG